MAKVYFLLGGNLFDREKYLSDAIQQMISRLGVLVCSSNIYETEPWGFEHELNFLNQVVIIKTCLPPLEILDITQQIERDLGRIRKKNQYSERTIDIDILFYEDEIIASDRLIIPHPRIQERLFALAPMSDVAPDFVHPRLGKSIKDLLSICPDPLKVKKFRP